MSVGRNVKSVLYDDGIDTYFLISRSNGRCRKKTPSNGAEYYFTAVCKICDCRSYVCDYPLFIRISLHDGEIFD